jgi:hypothetical protein
MHAAHGLLTHPDELRRNQRMKLSAAPIAFGDQILRTGKRMKAATELTQEVLDAIAVMGCLHGDGLDYRKQVLGAMADFPQQRLHGGVSTTLLCHIVQDSQRSALVRHDLGVVKQCADAVCKLELQRLQLLQLQAPINCSTELLGEWPAHEVGFGFAQYSGSGPNVGQVLRHVKTMIGCLVQDANATSSERCGERF